MRISALEEYGLRCLLALAKEGPNGQLSISVIAEKEGLSVPYASKLLSILRQTGLVKAIRGRSGGFRIARDPKDINLLEALTGLGGPLIDPNHCGKYTGQLKECIHTEDCSVHYTLVGLANLVGEFLGGTTLQNLLDGAALYQIGTVDSRVEMANHTDLCDQAGKSKTGTNNRKSFNV